MDQIPMRILVVEDDPHSRTALAALLRVRGFGVVEAADGAEALEKLHASAPDLLLCDWNLGGTPDGIEVAKRAQQLFPDLRIVFLTGQGSRTLRAKLGSVSVDGILQKPVDVRQLSALLRS